MTRLASVDDITPRRVVVVLDTSDTRLGGIPGKGKLVAAWAVLAALALESGCSVYVHDSTKENRS